jgi:hypothetical protein
MPTARGVVQRVLVPILGAAQAWIVVEQALQRDRISAVGGADRRPDICPALVVECKRFDHLDSPTASSHK